jgi:glycerol kinase
MAMDTDTPIGCLRVDGGASVSNFMMQFQADLLGIPVDRPEMVETTAQGAAWLAGLAAGIWSDVTALEESRHVHRVFLPASEEEKTVRLRNRWKQAVERAKDWERADQG